VATLTGCFKGSPQETDETTMDHALFDSLLRRNVQHGLVNYEGFKQDHELLALYLSILSQNPPASSWSNDEKLAYWINAYNAFTIALVIQHLPLESIKDITTVDIPFVHTPWQIDFIEIGETTYNLDDIEHGIIRKEFDEPRIHFALVCASRSCPLLRREAYTGEKLEQQLTEQAKLFLSDHDRNVIKKDTIKISKIFQWYRDDFTTNTTLIEFLNQYSQVKIDTNATIEYLEYDWRLNTAE